MSSIALWGKLAIPLTEQILQLGIDWLSWVHIGTHSPVLCFHCCPSQYRWHKNIFSSCNGGSTEHTWLGLSNHRLQACALQPTVASLSIKVARADLHFGLWTVLFLFLLSWQIPNVAFKNHSKHHRISHFCSPSSFSMEERMLFQHSGRRNTWCLLRCFVLVNILERNLRVSFTISLGRTVHFRGCHVVYSNYISPCCFPLKYLILQWRTLFSFIFVQN